eukprot:jgi/Botrbrau1/1112/Bobra.0162s0013.1
MAGAGSGFHGEVVSTEWSERSHACDHSPRGGRARSQVSMAVSFEGPLPQGSAGLSSQAGGESALSAAEQQQEAEGAGEHSSQPSLPRMEEEQDQNLLQCHAEHPANSLLSTAMRPSSPPIHRANSVVSYTAAHGVVARAPSGARDGTPASVYGQGRVPLPCPRPQSPEGSVAGAEQQHSSAGDEVRTSAQRSSRRPSNMSARGGLRSQYQTFSAPAAFNQDSAAVGPQVTLLDGPNLSVNAFQEGRQEDSQRIRPPFILEVPDADDAHAAFQPLLVEQVRFRDAAREGVGSLGSRGDVPSCVALRMDAVPQAGSFIAGPALPPPGQGFAHPLPAHSASISRGFTTHANAMSQNRFSNEFVGEWLNPLVDAEAHAQLERLANGRYNGEGLVPRISDNMLGGNLRAPRPPQQALQHYGIPSRVPLNFDPRISHLVLQGSYREGGPPPPIPDGPAQSGTHGDHNQGLAQDNFPRDSGVILSTSLMDGAVSDTAAAGGPRDVPQAAKVSGLEGMHDWQGNTHHPFPPFESRGASPAVDQAFPHTLAEDAPEPAHAAASVHATVLSEEDVQSEVETDLSSMHGGESSNHVAMSLGLPGHPRCPTPRSRSGGGSLHGTGLRNGMLRQTPGSISVSRTQDGAPWRINSTDGMAGAPGTFSAVTRSGTVDMLKTESVSGRTAPQASNSGVGASEGLGSADRLPNGYMGRESHMHGATSAPGTMPIVRPPNAHRLYRDSRSPPVSAGPALAVDEGAEADNLLEVEASAKVSKLDGTPSFSRLGVHHNNLANVALRGSALGTVQDGQPLSVVTTAADNLPAGSLGSNGEEMDDVEEGQQDISGRAERQLGNMHDGSLVNGPLPLPNGRVRSGDAGLGGPALRGRGGPRTRDIATSHPRHPPSPSASNASCGQAACDTGRITAANSFDSHVPVCQGGEGRPASAMMTLSGAMPALTVLTNGAGLPTAPVCEMESVPAPGALLPPPGPQPALTIVSGGVVDSWQHQANHARNSRRSSSQAAMSQSCDSACGPSNGLHTPNGRTNGHLHNGHFSGGSSSPVTSPTMASPNSNRSRRESHKRKRSAVTAGRRTAVSSHH